MGYRIIFIASLVAVLLFPSMIAAQAEFMRRGHSGMLGAIGYTANEYASARNLSAGIGLNGVLNISVAYINSSAPYGGNSNGYSVSLEILAIKLQSQRVILSMGPAGEFTSSGGSSGILSGGGALYLSLRTSEHIQVVPALAVYYNDGPIGIREGFVSNTIGLGFLAVGDNGLGVLLATSFSVVGGDMAPDNTSINFSLGVFFDGTEAKRFRDRKLFGE